MKPLLGLALSDREIHFIGTIVAHWVTLEYQVFEQTLLTFSDPNESLPREMNNLQVSALLDVWNERVVLRKRGKRKAVLTEQLHLIRQYLPFRDALVHGMWSWDPSALHMVTTTRVKKGQILRHHFIADDLQHFALEVTDINAKVRWPGGTKDMAKEHQGVYMSRRFLTMATGGPVAKDFFPFDRPKEAEAPEM